MMLFSGQIAKRIERELNDTRVDAFIRLHTNGKYGKTDLLQGMALSGYTFTDIAKLPRVTRRGLLARYTDFATTTEAFDSWEAYKQQ
ncbi:hypothetical protein EQG49_05725 [Periweissella cryptocerci]|uniref:Uncharacterized protein n=1 Tax=Periweissella cryptocerci TaxID=2506420 RepID=A0A4P6YTJ9_9LACO|nr:hypothetical protein [Periweissella cryptocerci]QBO35993.1 hypothetical protein EQG49_05725 [Periweissella cryptocerci]